MPLQPLPVEPRFWKNVQKSTGCWVWTGCKHGGYGAMRVRGKYVRAHRISYEMTHGSIPDGLIVRHKCDNPPCVNPEHLELGTHKDNAHDRDSRGRAADVREANNPIFKLPTEAVDEIRSAPTWRGMSKHFAMKFGISEQYVRQLRSDRSLRT